MTWYQILISIVGVPTIISSIVIFFIKRRFEKLDKKRDEEKNKEKAERKEKEELEKKLLEEREKKSEDRMQRQEALLLAILNGSLATTTLSMATAKAVQRIPDAKCNGDMKKALKQAEECKYKEDQLLMSLGIHSLTQ